MTTPTREEPNDNISTTPVADSSSSSGDSSDNEIDRGFLKDQTPSVDVRAHNSPLLFLDGAVSSNKRGVLYPGAMFCEGRIPHATGAVSRMNSNEWKLSNGLESLKTHVTCLSSQLCDMQKARWQEADESRRTWVTVGITVAGIVLVGFTVLSTTYQLTGIYRNLRG